MAKNNIITKLCNSVVPLLLIAISFANAEDLYFVKKSTVIRWSAERKTIDTVWKAPFRISDVSISRDGKFICFTKDIGKNDSDPARGVGYYSVPEKSITVIKSQSRFNYGAVISPNDQFIAYNYMPRAGDWNTAIYDRKNDSTAYYAFSFRNFDISSVFDWRSDSLLLFSTLGGIVEKNIYDKTYQYITLPDTSTMSGSVPGTQLYFINDSVYFVRCDDAMGYIKGVDGPPSAMFYVKGFTIARFISGNVDVGSSLLSNGILYVEYTDYEKSKKGIMKLIRYDVLHDIRTYLKSFGEFVGVVNN